MNQSPSVNPLGIPLLSEESFDKAEVTERIHRFEFDSPTQAVAISSLFDHIAKIIRKDWTSKFRKNEDAWKGIKLKKVYTEYKIVDKNRKMKRLEEEIALLQQEYDNEKQMQIARGHYTVDKRKSVRATW